MGRAPASSAPAPQVRPRYGRIGAAGGAVVVTLVAVLGGIGWLPADAPASAAEGAHTQLKPLTQRSSDGHRSDAGLPAAHSARTMRADTAQTAPAPVPAHSGSGRRVVFDMTAQRVWLVDPGARKKVLRTYLVSGSVTDNLKPGSYEVYSRSLHAIGVDDSGTMDYMVRFTQGDNAAIGFHDIPVKDGELVQRRADLGTPQSHGCIRQWRPDARALWRFAPVGTSVVVVA